VVQTLHPYWANDEIGSQVPGPTVTSLLSQLAMVEAQESSSQIQRTRQRQDVFEEELVKHVWHPSKAESFEALGEPSFYYKH
jgi:hypothetical protein